MTTSEAHQQRRHPPPRPMQSSVLNKPPKAMASDRKDPTILKRRGVWDGTGSVDHDPKYKASAQGRRPENLETPNAKANRTN